MDLLELSAQLSAMWLATKVVFRELSHRLAKYDYARWNMVAWLGVDLAFLGISVALSLRKFDDSSTSKMFWAFCALAFFGAFLAHGFFLSNLRPDLPNELNFAVLFALACSWALGVAVFVAGAVRVTRGGNIARAAAMASAIAAGLPLAAGLLALAVRHVLERAAVRPIAGAPATLRSLRRLVMTTPPPPAGSTAPPEIDLLPALLRLEKREVRAVRVLGRWQRILNEVYFDLDVLRWFQSAYRGDSAWRNAFPPLEHYARTGRRDARAALKALTRSTHEPTRTRAKTVLGRVSFTS